MILFSAPDFDRESLLARRLFLGCFVRTDAGNWIVMPANLSAGKSYFASNSGNSID